MATSTPPLALAIFLEEHCARIRRQRLTVLFRRGEKAFGAFLVLSGKVSLDPELPQGLAHCYGAGALVGLPAMLTKRDYMMTATVVEDAELGFLPLQTLESLMKANAELCHELLKLLSERMLEIQRVQKKLLQKGHKFLDHEAA